MEFYRVYKKPIKEVLTLGVPLLFSRIFNYLINFADTAMVGQLGTPDLAAISLSWTFYVVLLVICLPMIAVSQAVVSRNYSSKHTETGKCLAPLLLSALVISVAVFVISIITEPLIHINIDNNIQEKSAAYLSVIRYSLTIMPITGVLIGFLAGIRRTTIIIITTITGNASNIILNYLLIFGHASFPRMGISGAAIASLIAEALMLTMLIIYLITSGIAKKYELLSVPSVSMADVKTIIMRVAPISIQNSFGYSIFLIYKLIIGQIDSVLLSASHIVFIFYRINKVLVQGFASSSSILISTSLAKNDLPRTQIYFRIAICLAFIVGCVVLVVTIIWARSIATLFSQDENVIVLATTALRLFAIFFLIEITTHPLEAIFSSIGWGQFVLIAEGIPNILFTFASTLFFANTMGKDGILWIWGSFATYQVIFAAVLFCGYFSRRWRNMKIELPSTSV